MIEASMNAAIRPGALNHLHLIRFDYSKSISLTQSILSNSWVNSSIHLPYWKRYSEPKMKPSCLILLNHRHQSLIQRFRFNN